MFCNHKIFNPRPSPPLSDPAPPPPPCLPDPHPLPPARRGFPKTDSSSLEKEVNGAHLQRPSSLPSQLTDEPFPGAVDRESVIIVRSAH
jgi:hypothetical protein